MMIIIVAIIVIATVTIIIIIIGKSANALIWQYHQTETDMKDHCKALQIYKS